jgi:nitrite reductase (NADH) large subunit
LPRKQKHENLLFMALSGKSWRCLVCGYVHHGDNAPEFCPVCGAAGTDFEAYEESGSESPARPAKQWRCPDCGHILDADAPPEFCPICGASRDRFEPIPEAEPPAGEAKEAIKAVILGGGIAGVAAAEAVREASSESQVILVCAEAGTPYYRLNLTRYLAGEIKAASLQGDARPVFLLMI